MDHIALAEGTYSFEAFQFEGGGGANLSILYSLGDKTGVGNDGTFAALSTSTGTTGNEGWAAVPEPASVVMVIGGFGALLGFQRVRRRH